LALAALGCRLTQFTALPPCREVDYYGRRISNVGDGPFRIGFWPIVCAILVVLIEPAVWTLMGGLSHGFLLSIVVVGALSFLSAILSENLPTYSKPLKSMSVILISALVLLAAYAFIFHYQIATTIAQTNATPNIGDVNGNRGVITQGQSGGTNIGTQNNYAAPPNPNDGWLTPGNDPMPPSGCVNFPPNTWRIYFGGKNTAILGRGGEVKLIVIGELLVWFDSRGGPKGDQIAISAKIYGQDGLIAEITQNQFTVNPSMVFKIDHPDPHRLIVRDKWGDQVLDVTFLNREAISLKGTIRSRRGAKIVIDDNGLIDYNGSQMSGVCSEFPAAVFISPIG
jgi:hypothetical protein